jgi:hypothetical protein
MWNIPLIERTLVFRMIEMFRNTTTKRNTESRIGKPMFHMFRMFRLIRGRAAGATLGLAAHLLRRTEEEHGHA